MLAVHYAPGAGEAMTASLAEALDKTPMRRGRGSPIRRGGRPWSARYGEIEPAWACAGRLRANGISPSC